MSVSESFFRIFRSTGHNGADNCITLLIVSVLMAGVVVLLVTIASKQSQQSEE